MSTARGHDGTEPTTDAEPTAEAEPTAGTERSSEPIMAPFAGWIIKPEWADLVISRAYDTFSPDQRREIAAENRYNYVNVTRSPEDLLPGYTATIDELVAEGVSAFRRLLSAEAFQPTGQPSFYVYRMTTHGRSQTGVVGTIPVSALSDGRVRVHENVRPDRTALLTRHLMEVGATSSPIALTFRNEPAYSTLVGELTTGPPALDHLARDSDVRHEMWIVPIERTGEVAALLADRVMYLTDGHHRAAAAIAARDARPDDPPFARTLAIAFPEDHLRIDAFHRMVADSLGRPPADIVEAISAVVSLEEVPGLNEAHPTRSGDVGMYLAGRWYHLELPDPVGHGPVDRLDVEVLRTFVLDPILGADELGQSGAVGYVAEPTGIASLVHRCDADGLVGFVVHPTSIEELMAVADAGQLMPPKSSYVAPKPCAGVFLRVLGVGATAYLEPS
jgi:uncharacterized protein (DUF1015 family)